MDTTWKVCCKTGLYHLQLANVTLSGIAALLLLQIWGVSKHTQLYSQSEALSAVQPAPRSTEQNLTWKLLRILSELSFCFEGIVSL